jgi:hypothetical protein
MAEKKPEKRTRIPYKTMAKHLGAVALGTAGGYALTGAALHPVWARKIPAIHRRLEAMTPQQRRRIAAGVGIGTGMLIPVARGAHHLALASDMWRDFHKKEKKEEPKSEKVAAMVSVYEIALTRLL